MKDNRKYGECQKENFFNFLNTNQSNHTQLYNLLKKVPHQIDESDCHELSSIISDIEPTTKQITNHQIYQPFVVNTGITKRINVNEQNSINKQNKETRIKNKVDMNLIFKKNISGVKIQNGMTSEQKMKRMSLDKNKRYEEQKKINDLKEQNNRLNEQNNLLKKQIKKLCSSNYNSKIQSLPNKPSILNSFDQFHNLQQSNQILKNKLNYLKKNTTLQKTINHNNTTTNSTNHILTMKNSQAQSKKSQQNHTNIFSVSSIYSKAFTNAKMPDINSFRLTLENYLKQFQQTFIKIKFMYDNLDFSEPQSQIGANNEDQNRIKQLVNLFKVPVIYKNKPNIIDSVLNMNKSNMKLQSNPSIPSLTCIPPKKRQNAIINITNQQSKPILEMFSPELLSSEDTINMLEQICCKICKSNNMIKICRENLNLMKSLQKIWGKC